MKRLELEQLIKNNPPRFKHDCERCVYLGPYNSENHYCDLYVCPVDYTSNNCLIIDELIARRSDDSGHYSSGVEFALIHSQQSDYDLTEALCRALCRALELGYSIGSRHYTQIEQVFSTITLKRWKAYHKDHHDDAQHLHTINKKHQYAYRKNRPAAQNLLRYEAPNPDQIPRRSASKFHRIQPQSYLAENYTNSTR